MANTLQKTGGIPSRDRARRVVVALMTQSVAGREKLDAILDAASEFSSPWRLIIYRSAAEFTAATVRREIALGAAGFMVGIPDARPAMSVLARSTVPVVVLNLSYAALARRAGGVAIVRQDPEEIGRAAARELLATGLRRSFGYLGWRRDEEWSVARGKAFREALQGETVRFFDRSHWGDRIEDPSAAAHWLARLPKPCALFASCDDRAWEILETCREAGLRVPADVAVLGVNDDPALCERSRPRLSSVRPDFAGEGRIAAEFLGAMMDGTSSDDAKPLRRTVPIVGITRRESTATPNAAAALAGRAMDWLRVHAAKGVRVGDVARAMHVSPSLLERRFRETFGESVYEAALRLRLAEVCRRLRETDEPVAAITAACGWPDPAPPKRLFKKRFGVSMRAWRNSSAKAGA